MDSFNKTNLQNIKDIFEEKTGVALKLGAAVSPSEQLCL